ncbi:hypothetical protein [Nocardiopsis sp. YSL2]|nr:hypothetical protein [Nocardiopsis sp. YSL2]
MAKDISRVEQLTGHATGWSGGVVPDTVGTGLWGRPFGLQARAARDL